MVAHEHRRAHFAVAVLAGLQVEHELAKRAFEPRKLARQHDEARPGNFRGTLEIHHAEGDA